MLSDRPVMEMIMARYNLATGRSDHAGAPATHHIRAGIPTIKMAKPRKSPKKCFISFSM